MSTSPRTAEYADLIERLQAWRSALGGKDSAAGSFDKAIGSKESFDWGFAAGGMPGPKSRKWVIESLAALRKDAAKADRLRGKGPIVKAGRYSAIDDAKYQCAVGALIAAAGELIDDLRVYVGSVNSRSSLEAWSGESNFRNAKWFGIATDGVLNADMLSKAWREKRITGRKKEHGQNQYDAVSVSAEYPQTKVLILRAISLDNSKKKANEH